MRYFHAKVNLRRLILWLCLFFVFLSLANSFYASYRVQRDVLTQNTLAGNKVYAQKTASTAEGLLKTSVRILAGGVAERWGVALDKAKAQEVVARIDRMSQDFNSLVIVNANGIVVATEPTTLGLVGQHLESAESQRMLRARQPFISEPFRAVTGRWLIALSSPIYLDDGSYGGFIIGTNYLHESGSLQAALGVHQYQDGSVVYVVDDDQELIYTPRPADIGTKFLSEPLTHAFDAKTPGSLRYRTQDGQDVLAGYAPIDATGWWVIVEKPSEHAHAAVSTVFWRTLLATLPIILISLAGIWWLSKAIALPLNRLASVTMDSQDAFLQIRKVNAWYQEAADLRRALLTGIAAIAKRIGKLRKESSSDPLTGLTNRRGLKDDIEALESEEKSVAIVVLDIDKFKSINDTYGHVIGDVVIRQVAQLARAQARDSDIVARLGGEEFAVLLPGVSLVEAMGFSERLRLEIAQASFEGCGAITASFGVAHYPAHGATIEEVLKCADEAMYEAKRSGRNCTRVVMGSRGEAEFIPVAAAQAHGG